MVSLVKTFFPKCFTANIVTMFLSQLGGIYIYDFYLIINAYCTGTQNSNLGNNLLLPEPCYDWSPCLVLVNKHSKCYEIPFFSPLSEPAHFCHLVLKKKKKVCLMARISYIISVSKITIYTYFLPFNINVDGFDSFQG